MLNSASQIPASIDTVSFLHSFYNDENLPPHPHHPVLYTHTAFINRIDFTKVARGRVETKKSRHCKIELTSNSALEIMYPTLMHESETLQTLSFAIIIRHNIFKEAMSDI